MANYVFDTKLFIENYERTMFEQKKILFKFYYRTALPLLADVLRTLGKRPVLRLLQPL